MTVALSQADLVWSAAFHVYGLVGFVIVVLVMLIEAPLLRLALRSPWDDTIGAVFAGHLVALFAAILLGLGFTEALREFVFGPLNTWSGWTGLTSRLAGTFLAGAIEVVSWPTRGKVASFSALGFSCLTFLVTVSAILRTPWSWRTTGAILGVSLLTSLGIGASILLRTRTADGVEAA